MAKFNAKDFALSTKFACARCGKCAAYGEIANGCSYCRYHLFNILKSPKPPVIAQRGNTPRMTDPDGQMNPMWGDDYPYLRQKQKAKDTGSGRGDKYTTPGTTGLGTNDREGYPDIPTQFGNDEVSEKGHRPRLPSEETFIDSPPSDGYEVHGKFTKPGDVFSPGEQYNRDSAGWDQGLGYKPESNQGGTLDSRLRQQRVSPSNDDNIFGFTRRKQKGIRR